jgi:hypothetical protein
LHKRLRVALEFAILYPSRVALQRGMNANPQRTWITRYQRQRAVTVGRPASELTASAESFFVPVVVAKAPARSQPVQFCAQFSNGIKLDPSESRTPANLSNANTHVESRSGRQLRYHSLFIFV